MRIVEITASKSRKKNRGNFESEDYFLSLKAVIESNDDSIAEVSAELFARANLGINKEMKKDEKLLEKLSTAKNR